MNPRVPNHVVRIYVLLLFVAACLAGLMQGTNVSSSSGNRAAGAADRLDFELFTKNDALLKQLFLQTPVAKIAPRVLSETSDGKSTPVVILLTDQADVSAANSIKDQDARGWYVYNTLTQHAVRTQVDLQAFLKSHGVTYQSFWAANMLVASADRQLIDLLAARADVARVDSNLPTRWIEKPEVAKFGVTSAGSNAPNVVEAGVTNVNAPAVWALGFTGQGMIVGNQDTGMLWDHDALKPKYRGWNGVTADHNFNWHDSIHSGGGSCGANTVAPCDDQGHGTHTTGTTVGDDGTNQVGVAPGAKWIGCRNMDQGNGTPATYSECFQFFIAPTDLAGNNPNPALRPHVMNNSWGCPVSEGCTTGTELQTIVNNAQAAGIFVVASAGNAGPNCSTVQDAPAFYDASFSVGAISSATNTLASFSSRGPGTLAPNLLKPNISAPGVSVRSTLRTSTSSFGTMSGTSMAGPHVVGVVALLWSARPNLVRNIPQTKAILQSSANPAVVVSPAQTCGGTTSTQIPNNSFGYGRVDALAAVNLAPTAAPADVSGTVTAADGTPLAGVTIRLGGAVSRKTITDAAGNYRFEKVDSGNFYTVTPERVNYDFSPETRSFSLTGDRTDAVFTATPEVGISANPLDTSEYFVRQHYVDFLGREPDESGFNFWSDQIIECGSDARVLSAGASMCRRPISCRSSFSKTGGLVDGLYRASYSQKDHFMPSSCRMREWSHVMLSSAGLIGRNSWKQTNRPLLTPGCSVLTSVLL